MKTRLVLSLLVVALLGAACGATDAETPDQAQADRPSTGPTATDRPLPAPVRSPRECDPAQVAEVPPGITYDCFWVTVPEHHVGFDGDTLRLAVTVLHSAAPSPSPIPVVYIAGGPGGPGGAPNRWATLPYIADRDVIVYDQRGTGASGPDMECRETERGVVDMFSTSDPFAEEVAALDKQFAACHARLEAAGVDTTAFTTTESAADLADIRVALGYDLWNLFGVSYGTRVAREALRTHPEGINGVVLDSMAGPYGMAASAVAAGADRAFAQLDTACDADIECVIRDHDVSDDLSAAIERFDTEPYRATVDLGPGYGPTAIALTGSDMYWVLWGLLYFKESYPALPGMIATLAQGDGSEIAALLPAAVGRIQMFAEGMQRSVTCADRAPMAAADTERDEALLTDPGRWSTVLVVLGTQPCQAWPSATSDPAILRPGAVDRKVLVLSGTLDPITPTPVAEQVAAAMGHATFVAIGGLGHGAFDDSACASDLITAYLAQPAVDLDTSCARQPVPIHFSAA